MASLCRQLSTGIEVWRVVSRYRRARTASTTCLEHRWLRCSPPPTADLASLRHAVPASAEPAARNLRPDSEDPNSHQSDADELIATCQQEPTAYGDADNTANEGLWAPKTVPAYPSPSLTNRYPCH